MNTASSMVPRTAADHVLPYGCFERGWHALACPVHVINLSVDYVAAVRSNIGRMLKL
jgi:hypothetical protein